MSNFNVLQEGSVFPVLKQNQVHVWSVDLDTLPDMHQVFLKILSENELETCSRYVFQQDGDRYLVRRALLRLLLSQYLDCDPGSLQFICNRYGKPQLDFSSGIPHIHFNISHSSGKALLAFSLDMAVGIDIERIDESFDYDCMLPTVFSEQEQAQYASLPPASRCQMFYSAWTSKEAVIKAIGQGLSIPPNSFSVQMPTASDVTLKFTPIIVAEQEWFLSHLSIDERYAAALAVEQGEFNVHIHFMPPSRWLRKSGEPATRPQRHPSMTDAPVAPEATSMY